MVGLYMPLKVNSNNMGILDFFNKPQKPIPPVMTENISGMYTPPEDIYAKASNATSKKYGVVVPPHFLKAVQQQESSGMVNKKNFNLSMGFTPTAAKALGKDYLQPTSLDNVVQNSSNYLASRAKLTLNNGQKVDLSTPENFSKWYVQRYVGVLPGKSRLINGENVPYEKIVSSFEKLLKQYQQ
jgi:hypothetical protein